MAEKRATVNESSRSSGAPTPERTALLRRNARGLYESYALVPLHTYGAGAKREHLIEALRETGYAEVIEVGEGSPKQQATQGLKPGKKGATRLALF